MKKLLTTSVIACITLVASAQQGINIRTVSAKDVKTIIDTSTTPLIVNFWASWCGPCIREIPYFESQVAQLKTPVRLLLVSIDYPEAFPKRLTEFVTKKNYKSEVIYLKETDPVYFTATINPKWTGAIPVSIFVNNATKYYAFHNSQLTEPQLEAELKRLVQ